VGEEVEKVGKEMGGASKVLTTINTPK